MENKYFRSSINSIPKDQSKLRSSSIPFFFSVEFQKEGLAGPTIQEALIRCDKCKAYLNPFVEIINPGFKWKCNLCDTINEVSIPFQMKERKVCDNNSDPLINSTFNRSCFLREELINDIYEIEAPDSFNVTTPDQPILCFLIEITAEAANLNVLYSVLNCIKETLKTIDYDRRTKIAIMFFNESVYILNNSHSFTIINGEVPLILSEKILFTLEGENSFFNINFEKIEKFFQNKKSNFMNYLLALQTCVQAFRSATLLSFVTSIPNFGEGKLEASNSLICKNNFYKEVAESLVRKNICCNLFVLARGSVELSSIKVPSQYTGGQILHYANYDGGDACSTSKLYCDLSDYFNRETNFGAVCRIRANEGIVLKSVYGNFYQKGSDLISYSNYNPGHNINFTIQIYNEIKSALYVQIAMARVVKNGRKLIRVMNICIPVGIVPFYENCDAYSISHCLCLESFYYESKKKLGGKENLENKLGNIWSELRTNYGKIPESLYNLPIYISSIMKSIPFRPDLGTPADYRGYYMYILSNYPTKIIDLIIYPLLLNILTENVTPLPLSYRSIDQNGIYILDTGVNLFFYIGSTCDQSVIASLFDNPVSGTFIFNPPENDFSKYVSELIVYLTNDRIIKPRFVLANGQGVSVYNDIFFSYMYEDSLFQLPSAIEFRNVLESKK